MVPQPDRLLFNPVKCLGVSSLSGEACLLDLGSVRANVQCVGVREKVGEKHLGTETDQQLAETSLALLNSRGLCTCHCLGGGTLTLCAHSSRQ